MRRTGSENIYSPGPSIKPNTMTMSVSIWLTILGIITISGIVKGTTGFGFALFSLPLLIHFIPVKNLVPLITLFNLFTSVLIIIQMRDIKFKKSILLLSITGSLGVIIGTVFLKYMPELLLKLIASVVLIIIALLFLSGSRFKIRKIKRGNTLAGLVSGFLGGSLSVSGPPLALFLTSLHIDSKNFRYTFAWFSIVTASIATIDYIKMGFINQTFIIIFLVSIPILLLSVWIGRILNNKIATPVFYKGVIIITLLSGICLLYTSLDKVFSEGIVSLKSIKEIFHLARL